MIDDHSRYGIVLPQTGSTGAELVQEQLQIALTENGVPEGMRMEHDIPWWSSTWATGATELSLWLMKQGMGLPWISKIPIALYSHASWVRFCRVCLPACPALESTCWASSISAGELLKAI